MYLHHLKVLGLWYYLHLIPMPIPIPHACTYVYLHQKVTGLWYSVARDRIELRFIEAIVAGRR
jgi:hypothetical protein